MALLKNRVANPEETNQLNEKENEETETMKEETTAVATTQQAAPPAESTGPVMPTIAELENRWDPLEYDSAFNRIIGTNGALQISEEELVLGEWIDVQVYSYNYRLSIMPDVDTKKDPDAKFCYRPSFDGKTIVDRESGDSMTIDEYCDSVEEYDDWKKSEYKDIYVIVLNSHKNADKAIAAGVLKVQVSPTSLKGFKGFAKQGNLFVARGLMLPSHRNCMRINAESVSKNGNNWVMMKFEPIPVDEVTKYTPVPE